MAKTTGDIIRDGDLLPGGVRRGVLRTLQSVSNWDTDRTSCGTPLQFRYSLLLG
jgi:hypothetical protein